MTYLYGDSTPFPLAENFLVTACAATTAAGAILRAEELAVEGRRAVRDTEVRVSHELARLEALERRVLEVLGPCAAESGSPTQLAGCRILELTRASIERGRSETLGWRETAAELHARAAPSLHALPALEAFLKTYQLPETGWGLRWAAGLGCVHAEVCGRTSTGLEALFDVQVPTKHAWARPFRVSAIHDAATIQLTKSRWFGAPRPGAERLDRLFVTAFTNTAEHAAMRLTSSATGQSSGVEIVLKTESATGPVAVTRLGSGGVAEGAAEPLGTEDAAVVHRIWRRLEATSSELVLFRQRMRSATLRGVAVEEVVHLEVLAEAIIDAVAPLVSEIAQRSSPGELVLKCVIGDGRREELFVSPEMLLAGTVGLSSQHRALFDAYRLGERPAPPASVRRLLPPPRPRPPPLPVLRAANS